MTGLLIAISLMLAETPTFEEVEVKALESRKSIRSAVIEVEADVKLYKNEEMTRRNQMTVKIFVEDERIRADYVRKSRTDESTYRQSYCWTKDAVYLYTDEKAPGGFEIISKIISPDQKNADVFYRIPDPRRIGLICDTFVSFYQHDISECLVTSRGEISRKMTEIERDGRECYQLTKVYDFGTYTAWIDPARSYNVIAIEGMYESSRNVLKCELQQVEGFGWFPSKTRYEYHNPDGTLNREEDLTIKVFQINQPLSDEDFSPKGMPIPLGTIMHDLRNPSSRELIMTEDGLVPHLGR